MWRTFWVSLGDLIRKKYYIKWFVLAFCPVALRNLYNKQKWFILKYLFFYVKHQTVWCFRFILVMLQGHNCQDKPSLRCMWIRLSQQHCMQIWARFPRFITVFLPWKTFPPSPRPRDYFDFHSLSVPSLVAITTNNLHRPRWTVVLNQRILAYQEPSRMLLQYGFLKQPSSVVCRKAKISQSV